MTDIYSPRHWLKLYFTDVLARLVHRVVLRCALGYTFHSATTYLQAELGSPPAEYPHLGRMELAVEISPTAGPEFEVSVPTRIDHDFPVAFGVY